MMLVWRRCSFTYFLGAVVVVVAAFFQEHSMASLIINSIESDIREVWGGDTERSVRMYVSNTGDKDIWVDTVTLRFTNTSTGEDLSRYFVVYPKERIVVPRNTSNVKIELLVDIASEVPAATVELDGYIVGWENLIINGSFEELTVNPSSPALQLVRWCDWPNPDIYRSYNVDTSTFSIGKQSYKIEINNLPVHDWATTSTAGYPGGGVNKDWLYSVEPSSSYYIEITYKDDLPAEGVSRVLVWEEFDTAKYDLKLHHYFYPSHSEEWKKFGGIVTTRPQAAYIRVWIGVRALQSGVAGSFWVDEVIFRAEPKQLIEDSSADAKTSWTIYADTTPPASITDLAAKEGSRHGEVELSWTAPGNNGNEGVAAMYDIRYAEVQITENNWSSAIPIPSSVLLQPSPSGSREIFKVTGLLVGKTYYFAIKARDTADNWSEISNSPSAAPYRDTTPPSTPGRPRGYYDSSTKQLRFEWEPAADDESDIVKYLLCIGDTPGGNNVLDDFSVGNTTEYTVFIFQLNLSAGKRYFAKVKAENAAGLQSEYSDPSEGTLIEEEEEPPSPPHEITQNKLYPLYPVSFNPLAGESAVIKYDVVDESSKVTVKVYNVFGELVRTVINGEIKNGPQTYYELWDGKNDKGEVVGNGIYLVSISIGKKYNEVRKVLVVKK